MFYELSYYLFNSICLGGLCLGVSWVIYPEKTKIFVYSVAWELTKNSLILKDKAKKIINETKEMLIIPEREVNDEFNWKIMIIDGTTNHISTEKYLYEEFIRFEVFNAQNIEKIMYLSKIIDDKEYWKEMDMKYFRSIPKLKQLEYLDEMDIIEKPFIQILLHNNEDSIDINEYLDSFYVNGNKILSVNFLKWYLHYYYNIELMDNYKIDIIDSNIKMHTLKKFDGITFGNNVYEIISDAC